MLANSQDYEPESQILVPLLRVEFAARGNSCRAMGDVEPHRSEVAAMATIGRDSRVALTQSASGPGFTKAKQHLLLGICMIAPVALPVVSPSDTNSAALSQAQPSAGSDSFSRLRWRQSCAGAGQPIEGSAPNQRQAGGRKGGSNPKKADDEANECIDCHGHIRHAAKSLIDGSLPVISTEIGGINSTASVTRGGECRPSSSANAGTQPVAGAMPNAVFPAAARHVCRHAAGCKVRHS